VIRLRHVRLAFLSFLAISSAGAARAHDLERTRVWLTFESDGTFVLDVANDPNWLLLRLEDFVGDYPSISRAMPPASAPLSDEARDAHLRALAPAFIDRVVLWVDHREIRPLSAEYLAPRRRTDADDLPPLGVYRLRGRMPLDARAMQWYYGLVVDPYPLLVHRADGRAQPAETVLGSAWSSPLDLSGQFREQTRLQIARKYAASGYRLMGSRGVEPILFVLGIVLLGVGLGPFLAQLAALTSASALASGLVVYGVASLSPRVVEPLVALSVACIALDNLAATDLTPRRVAALVLFGLLHGMSYAAALAAEGLPEARPLAALLGFNAGIALGQATVAALAYLLVTSYRQRAWYHQRIAVPISLAIAGVGVYWTIARTIG
jgi:hypothetical protein